MYVMKNFLINQKLTNLPVRVKQSSFMSGSALKHNMTDNTLTKNKPKSLWKKGQSGNPLGRPKGAKGKAAELRKAIEETALTEMSEAMPQLIQQALEMALNGNEAMLKFCIERFIPKAAVSSEEGNKGLGGIVINVQSIDQVKAVPNGQSAPIEGELEEES